MTIDFRSPLADGMEKFLAYKRALGRRFDTEEKTLQLFDRYLTGQAVTNVDAVTPDLVDAFLASRPRASPRSYNHLLGVLDRLFSWLVAMGLLGHSPLRARPRRASRQRVPFLFDQDQARRLLEIAGELPDNSRALLRGPSYRMMFALLFGLGLRVGEVSRLCFKDVDFHRNLLVIRHTKLSKSRLVPFGPRMAASLRGYINCKESSPYQFQPDSPLFSFTKGCHIHPGTISQTFHALLPRLGLSITSGMTQPRCHDLRHSFAVGTLLRWYRTGGDPSPRLLHLSTFLGHVAPESTAVYLTITEALLQEANSRFARFSAPAIWEVKL